jgi:hypothetical protein
MERQGTARRSGIVGISSELVEQVRSWDSQYEEDRIPLNGPGDAEWLAEGVGLLRQLRTDLGDDFDLVVTEPWWGEAPDSL